MQAPREEFVSSIYNDSLNQTHEQFLRVVESAAVILILGVWCLSVKSI